MDFYVSKSFGKVHGDEFEILLLTEDDLEGALDVIRNAFLIRETVCMATEINLPDAELARQDLLELCREVFTDGVSLVAKQISTGKIVSVAFNKIQVANGPTEEPFFANFIERRCSSPNSRALINFMIDLDESYDLFRNLQVDCLLEIMFLATLSEFEGRKIAQALCKHSIQLARNLSETKGLKFCDKRIKAVSAIFTSPISQRVGQAMEMKTLNEIPYERFFFKGKSYAERLGPTRPFARLTALKF